MQKHILLLGGAGYIGSVLTRHLLEKNFKVTVYDALLYENENVLLPWITHPNFKFIKGDIRDSKLLLKALKTVTDVVLLASLVGDPISKKYPELTVDINENGAKNVIKTINNKGIDKFLFFSTCSNYGLIKENIIADEQTSLDPKSLYAKTKVNIENYILSNKDSFDFSPVIFRLATAFGLSPRMRFDLTVSDFTRQMYIQKKLLVYDENTWRPYCHTSDISKAVVLLLKTNSKAVRGEVFNVGNEKSNFTKKAIVEEISKFIPEVEISYKKGGFDPRNYRVSFEKIRTILNFEPDFTINNSILNLHYLLQNKFFQDFESRKNFYTNNIINL